jgi:hypothetical protein
MYMKLLKGNQGTESATPAAALQLMCAFCCLCDEVHVSTSNSVVIVTMTENNRMADILI